MAEQLDDIHDQLDSPESVATQSGPEVVRGFVKTLPGKPGVYRMYNASGDVLYVGKARNLKNRVQNYTRLGGHTNRIAAMIANTASMEFLTTATEAEALLLEANLIKKLKPHYNVILRDDKSFPYILIATDHPAAQITKHRGARSKKGDYYGPFASAGAVNQTINALQKAFLLRSCSDSVYENRTRPCLLYQIKRCAAPCTSEIPLADYASLVTQAKAFLAGKSSRIKADLANLMDEASEQLDFEQAARYRDRITAMSHVTSRQGINPQHVTEADVFGLAMEGGQVCIQVFFFRAGQNWGNRAYFPRAGNSFSIDEILASFVAQFYDDRPQPKLVLISHPVQERELIEEALSAKAGRRVQIIEPQRGEKRTLVEHAATNAREALGRRLADTRSQSRLLEGTAKVFNLPEPPRRIEIYDNSHIQGSNAVGAMVVAGREGLIKGQYRKFNIKSPETAPGDDVGMMREVMKRRFSRLIKEHGPRKAAPDGGDPQRDDELPVWPDLLLIDGGQGQLTAVSGILAELEITGLPVVGVAKGPDRDAGREHFYVPGKRSFMLEARNPVLYYIQRLRDEAHRFAIGSHRARRKKAIGSNPLDDISGIGPGRKKALLKAFGSAREVARANLADLQAVDGISRSLAQTIHGYFNESAR